ncbi:hypothetical protein MN608_08878 [Microdochium nivale]|nr:hypothetical protein MN608_08878 [Microdochium nivale]
MSKSESKVNSSPNVDSDPCPAECQPEVAIVHENQTNVDAGFEDQQRQVTSDAARYHILEQDEGLTDRKRKREEMGSPSDPPCVAPEEKLLERKIHAMRKPKPSVTN